MEAKKVYLYSPTPRLFSGVSTEYTLSSAGVPIDALLKKIEDEYRESDYNLDRSILLLFFSELVLSDKRNGILGDCFSFSQIVSDLKYDFKQSFLEQLEKDIERNLLRIDDNSINKLKESSNIVEQAFLFTVRNVLAARLNISSDKWDRAQSELFLKIQTFLKKHISECLLKAFVGIFSDVFSQFERKLLLKCKYTEERISEKQSKNIALIESLLKLVNCFKVGG